jgi:glycosyltransferase involved in cell wall biosynthesis
VPLWGTDDTVSPADVARVRRERGWGEGDAVFLYSGNMGLGHRLGEFLAAARACEPREVLWCFLGGGARRGEVEAAMRAASGARLQLLPYVSPAELWASLAAADVHLVSLRREWQGLIVPSKLQAAFSVGRPVVFVGPEENEAAAWIRLSGGGWRAGEGDVDGLLACVREASVASARAERGARALAFAREHFSRERNCGRIADLLEQAVDGRRG